MVNDLSKPVTSGILELASKLKESSIVNLPFNKIKSSSLMQSIRL